MLKKYELALGLQHFPQAFEGIDDSRDRAQRKGAHNRVDGSVCKRNLFSRKIYELDLKPRLQPLLVGETHHSSIRFERVNLVHSGWIIVLEIHARPYTNLKNFALGQRQDALSNLSNRFGISECSDQVRIDAFSVEIHLGSVPRRQGLTFSRSVRHCSGGLSSVRRKRMIMGTRSALGEHQVMEDLGKLRCLGLLPAWGFGFQGCQPGLRLPGGAKNLGSREGVPCQSLKHPHHSEKDIPAGDNGTGIELHIGLISFEIVGHSSELGCLGKRGHFGQVEQHVESVRTVGIARQISKVLADLFRIHVANTGSPNPPSFRVNPVVDGHKKIIRLTDRWAWQCWA